MGNIWVATDLHLFSRDNDSRHPFRSRHNLGKLSDQFAQDIQEDDLLIFLGDLSKLIRQLTEIVSGTKIGRASCRERVLPPV